MELLLNLIWAAIALASVRAYIRACTRDRRKFLLGLGALLCVLMLLLPAISITDDLHLDVFAVEDASATKRVLSQALDSVPLSSAVWMGISLLGIWFAASQRKSWRPPQDFFPPRLFSAFRYSFTGRAPPFRSL